MRLRRPAIATLSWVEPPESRKAKEAVKVLRLVQVQRQQEVESVQVQSAHVLAVRLWFLVCGTVKRSVRSAFAAVSIERAARLASVPIPPREESVGWLVVQRQRLEVLSGRHCQCREPDARSSQSVGKSSLPLSRTPEGWEPTERPALTAA